MHLTEAVSKWVVLRVLVLNFSKVVMLAKVPLLVFTKIKNTTLYVESHLSYLLRGAEWGGRCKKLSP